MKCEKFGSYFFMTILLLGTNVPDDNVIVERIAINFVGDWSIIEFMITCNLSYQEIFFENGNSKVATWNYAIFTLKETEKGIHTVKDLYC